MLETLNRELRDLTRPLDFIRSDDAKTAAKAVVDKLATTLEAYIVDVYWNRLARGGSVLEPFVSVRSGSADKATLIIVNESKGILPWVFTEGKVAWIDEVRSKDWTKPIENLAAIDGVRQELKLEDPINDDQKKQFGYIEPSKTMESFSPGTNAIVALPLKHRGFIWGVLSLEFTSVKEYDSKLLVELIQTATDLSCLIWKSDVQEQNTEETREAVEEFSRTIAQAEIEAIPLTPHASCFFSRQFDDAGKFEEIEDKIKAILTKVVVSHYRDLGTDFVIKEIRRMIKSSHFCIVDITDKSPNVMMELGMMMMSDKNTIIIKHVDDDTPIPFNINQENVYSYKLENDQLWVKNISGAGFELFEPKLKKLAKTYIRTQE